MIKSEILESIFVKQKLLENEKILSQIEYIANKCLDSLMNGGKIILAGNGGSFADAQHISAEFTSKYMFERESLPSLSLGCNNSAITAIGNDYGYDQVFARELASIADSKDIFIAISTSGNSENILQSIKVANTKKITTFGFTGDIGGKMAELCECIKIPSSVTGRIQECHIMIGHIICAIVEKKYFKESSNEI